MHAPHSQIPVIAADLLQRLRARRPRVHCITNTVAQAFTANVLLAAGAVPSMTTDPDEIEDFVAGADALLVNLGTLDAERRRATELAVKAATRVGKPWVLDPVFIDRTPRRADFARTLMAHKPQVLRCNAAEFSALATPAQTPAEFAGVHGTVVALTGAADLVTDGARQVSIANGDLQMAKVTAMGCAASALVAAALAVTDDAWGAAVAALVVIGISGEIAAKSAAGPGSLAIGFIDVLHRLDADALMAHARLS